MSYIYEAAAVEMTWLGVSLNEGLGSDAFLQITPMAENWTHETSVSGEYTFIKGSDKGCTITLTTQGAAGEINDKITALSAGQKITGGQLQIAPFTVIDTTGATASVYIDNAVLSQDPEMSWSASSAGERVYTWIAELYVPTNDPAAVAAQLSQYIKSTGSLASDTSVA